MKILGVDDYPGVRCPDTIKFITYFFKKKGFSIFMDLWLDISLKMTKWEGGGGGDDCKLGNTLNF